MFFQKSRLLFLLGTVSLIACAALQLSNLHSSIHAEKQSQQLLSQAQTAVCRTAALDFSPFFPPQTEQKAQADSAARQTAIDLCEFAGILSFPCLHLELPVFLECDSARLGKAPCRQSGSAATDDLVIAGHNFKRHFGMLDRLKFGDPVLFTDINGETFRYTVSSTVVLAPSQERLAYESGHSLLLYTCSYTGKKRICVFCDRCL